MFRDRLVTYKGRLFRTYETIYLDTTPIGVSIFLEPSGPFDDDWKAGPITEVPLTAVIFQQPTMKVLAA